MPELSLAPVAARLAELLGTRRWRLRPTSVVEDSRQKAEALEPGSVMLLENTRSKRVRPRTIRSSPGKLADLADLYVNDAFGTAHRAHATTAGVAGCLPAYAGLLLEQEVENLTSVAADPTRPLVVVLGGAKVSDKVGVIDRFLEIADQILIGGAMCFPFFRAAGPFDRQLAGTRKAIPLAGKPSEKADAADCELVLPTDLALGREFSADTETNELDGVDVPMGWMGLDIGPKTAADYAERIAGGRDRPLERADGCIRT